MHTRFARTSILLLAFLASSAAALRADHAAAAAAPAAANALFLSPGPDDGRVAFWTAQVLEKTHYSRRLLDDAASGEFLDGYLESLDYQHLHFLQSDLAQFETYRARLDDLTIPRGRAADVRPAFEIFTRFIERVKQRVAYVDDLLEHGQFQFDSDERAVLNRHDLPYPRDLQEAKALWRQRVRYEYLQEKLALENPKKPKDKTGPPADGKSIHQQIVDKLKHRYQRNLKLFTDFNHEDVLGVYLTALARVYDPHSDYFNKAQLETFSISMNLQLFGIGAELLSDDGYCKIQRLLPGGPAIKSGKIQEGDHIVAVAQGDQTPVDVVDVSLTKVVQLIRGPKGTEVRLTVNHQGDASNREIVTLIRDEIPLDDQAAKGRIIEFPRTAGNPVRLGVIDLPSFYSPLDLGSGKPTDPAHTRSTSADVATLLAKYKKENVSGVILDLRRNTGGSLEEAVRLTGLFIKHGPVVQVRAPDFDGQLLVQVNYDRDPSVLYEGPLVVLTSRFSASASEIVAGALQDYGRAVVVGDISTHGKGTVQSLSSLRQLMRVDDEAADPGALKVTIRKFYRASGASTQKKGVQPDIVLPSILNVSTEVGESALDHSLEWDTIPSADFEKLNLVGPYLPELLRLSSRRTTTNQDFTYIQQDIEQYKKLQADKSVPLNRRELLREKQETEARQKARDQERLARKDPGETVYEITLKTAELPGLPPALQKTNSLALKTPNHQPGSAAIDPASSAAAVASGDPELEPGVPADEPKPAAMDATLAEAEQILLDYIALLRKGQPLLATQAEPRTP